MKKITVLDIKFYPHTVRWYRRKNQSRTVHRCHVMTALLTLKP